jgi:hypothetical protein
MSVAVGTVTHPDFVRTYRPDASQQLPGVSTLLATDVQLQTVSSSHLLVCLLGPNLRRKSQPGRDEPRSPKPTSFVREGLSYLGPFSTRRHTQLSELLAQVLWWFI